MPSDASRRRTAYMRDAPKPWLCAYCRDELTEQSATLDHKTPRSRGGRNHRENLQLCCFACNQSKSDMTDWEYRSWVRGMFSQVPTINDLVREAFPMKKKQPVDKTQHLITFVLFGLFGLDTAIAVSAFHQERWGLLAFKGVMAVVWAFYGLLTLSEAAPKKDV